MRKSFIKFYRSYKSKEILNFLLAFILAIIVLSYYGIFWLPKVFPNIFNFLNAYSSKIDLVNFAPYAILPILLFIFIMYDSNLLKLFFLLHYIFNLSYVFYFYILKNDAELGMEGIILKLIPYILSLIFIFILKEIFNRFKMNYRLESLKPPTEEE